MTPYRTPAATTSRRVPWHVRALAWAFRTAWRVGSPFDPWEWQVCRRAAGGVWERRTTRYDREEWGAFNGVVTFGPLGYYITRWYPARVQITRCHDIEAVEVWP